MAMKIIGNVIALDGVGSGGKTFRELTLLKTQVFVVFLSVFLCLNGFNTANSSMRSTETTIIDRLYNKNGDEIEVYDKIVGIGSYSTIYLGRDKITNALLAIKVQPYKEVEDINHEIAQLKRVGIYLGEQIIKKDKGFVHYLIMPYFQGESIEELYKSNRVISKKELLEILIASAKSLQAIHGKNIVHNDIHEGNLIYDNKIGKATWVDYAFAIKLPRSASYRKINIKGNLPLYKAPESNQQRGYATDIYQLGFMFLRMLLILTSDDINYRNKLIESRDVSYGELKKQPVDNSTKIFHKMMSKNWQERPSITEVIDECKKQIVKL
jgi:serine/threonine protein kinase